MTDDVNQLVERLTIGPTADKELAERIVDTLTRQAERIAELEGACFRYTVGFDEITLAGFNEESAANDMAVQVSLIAGKPAWVNNTEKSALAPTPPAGATHDH